MRNYKDSGFVFINQYNRYSHIEEFQAVEDLKFSLKLKNETIEFPSKAAKIEKESVQIWPFNIDLSGIMLNWATASPISLNKEIAFFYGNKASPSEFAFNQDVEIYNIKNAYVKTENNQKVLIIENSKENAGFSLKQNEKSLRIEVLSEDDSLKLAINNEIYLTDDTMFFDNDKTIIRSKNNNIEYSKYNFEKNKFDKNHMSLEKLNTAVELSPKVYPSKEAAVLKLEQKQEVAINIEGLSKIMEANLYLSSLEKVKVKVNGRTSFPKKREGIFVYNLRKRLDLGENILTFESKKPNNIAFELVGKKENEEGFGLISNKLMGKTIDKDFTKLTKENSYKIKLDETTLKLLEENKRVWLNIDYYGDQARLEVNNFLIVDNYYYKPIWEVELSHFREIILENKGILNLKIQPLLEKYNIYFETERKLGSGLKDVSAEVEYEFLIENR